MMLKNVKAKRGYGFIQYWIMSSLGCKKIERPVTIICGMEWKCEGSFEATDIERV
jgi:hypothetical protein